VGGQKNIVTLGKRSTRFRRDRPGSVERWSLTAVFERTAQIENMQMLQMKYRFHSLFIAFFGFETCHFDWLCDKKPLYEATTKRQTGLSVDEHPYQDGE